MTHLERSQDLEFPSLYVSLQLLTIHAYRHCYPLQYLLRDILQFDDSLQKAIQRITSAHRTCDLILGVGDGKVVTLSHGLGLLYQVPVYRRMSFVEWNTQPLWQISSHGTTFGQRPRGILVSRTQCIGVS